MNIFRLVAGWMLASIGIVILTFKLRRWVYMPTLSNIRKASYEYPSSKFAGCDEIWHAGDIGTDEVIERLNAIAPVRAVAGNIDGTKTEAPNNAVISYSIYRKLRTAERSENDQLVLTGQLGYVNGPAATWQATHSDLELLDDRNPGNAF